MNKKFLSAILFGALMVSSTGTFVSCKDYDDDIDEINSTLSDLKSQLSALQGKVDAGKYITNVATTADGITLTLNDGTSYAITNGKDGKPGTDGKPGEAGAAGDKIEVNKDGYFVINGEATEWMAVTKDQLGQTVKIKTPTVAENGTWVFYNEKGEPQSTTIKVAPVTAVQNADKSWTLTVFDAAGGSKSIEVPSAASMLTDLIVLDSEASLDYYTYDFIYNPEKNAINKTNKAPKRQDWKGPRALPSKDGKMVAGMTTIPVQINPTTIDATEVEFSLVNSQNVVPDFITLAAKEDKGLKTRAAYGNGLYNMEMEDIYFNSDEIAAEYYTWFEDQLNDQSKKILYAVTTGGTVRSEYTVILKATTTKNELTKVAIKAGSTEVYPTENGTEIFGGVNGSAEKPAYSGINLGQWYSVVASNAAALYDMYLSVNSDFKTLYGIELKNERGNWQFRITKTPDNITRANFPLVVETVDKEGTYNKTTIWVNQSNILTTGYTYDAISYQLKEKNANENRFNISLAEMKKALGADNLALWNTKVDLSNTTVTFYDPVRDEKVGTATIGDKTNGSVYGVAPIITEKNEDNQSNTTTVSKSNYIQFRIDNASAGTKYWVLNRQYIASVTFKNAAGDELTTTKVPFTLTIPAITTIFQLDNNFVVNGDAICYMYKEDKGAANAGDAAFKLNRVFSKFSTNSYVVSLDNSTKIGETGRTSAKLAKVGNNSEDYTTTATADATYITLANNDGNANLVDNATGLQAGYGQSLKLSISGNFAGTWSYGDEKFNFTVKVLSPIYEGGVQPRTGNAVVIPATKLDGYKFGNNDIVGNTYNTAVKYNVLPDKVDATPAWTRKEIAEVIAQSSNTNVFTLSNTTNGWATPSNATDAKDKDGKVVGVNAGTFTLNAQNVPTTTSTNSIKVQVKDIWGYKKPSTINVTITVE